MAQDYSALNRHTPHDKYGMHRPEEILQNMVKSIVFSVLDLRQGFLQIQVVEGDEA